LPFGVTRPEVPALLEAVGRAARDAGRDPSAVEVIMDSLVTSGDEVMARI
jgi:hypothetical protein